MDGTESGRDGRIVQGRDPAGAGVVAGTPFAEPGPQDVQQELVQQCGEHGIGAGTRRAPQFGPQEVDRRAQLRMPAHPGRQVDDLGQVAQERVGSGSVQQIGAAEHDRRRLPVGGELLVAITDPGEGRR